MKLEVGMHVRTDNGIINKVVEMKKDKQISLLNTIIFEKPMLIQNEFEYNYNSKIEFIEKSVELFVVKASHNIIDLIEVGDYVNGKLTHKIDIKENHIAWYLYDENNNMIAGKDSDGLQLKIKSIVTKEQYEANCYKVVE